MKKEKIQNTPTSGDWAVVLVGVGYIYASLSQMAALANYPHYCYLFQQYGENTIQFRYVISWAGRFAGLGVGAGLLFYKEIFRKAAVVLAFGTIAIIQWKHPFYTIERHIRYFNEHIAAKSSFGSAEAVRAIRSFGLSNFTESDFVRICMTGVILLDILCALVVIFILTRPRIKAIFH